MADAKMQTTGAFGATVQATVTRGAESWQFLAFIFAAVAAFLLSIVDELDLPHPWRILLKLVAFLFCFYLFMVNVRMRNKLIKFLGWIRVEKH
jgi:hypothetical protein